MNTKMELVKPNIFYKNSFVKMVQAIKLNNEENYSLYKECLEDFEAYVNKLEDHARGINLPEGWVPCYTYWFIDDMENVLGVVRIRTQLANEYLKNIAGHVGYDIAPQYRRQGFGQKLLELTLEKIQELGFKELLITSDEDNIASIKIIEACGGTLEKKVFDQDTNNFVKRYWFYY